MIIEVMFSGHRIRLEPDELRGASDAEIREAVTANLAAQESAQRWRIDAATRYVKHLLYERDGETPLAVRLARDGKTTIKDPIR